MSLAIPSVSFAEGTQNWQSTVSSLLSNLSEVQKTYAAVPGSVTQMPVSGLAPREKAATALELIRANVAEAGRSGKVPQDLLQNTLTAIDEAQNALRSENAQTIAWSLETVGQQVKAIDATFTGQPLPEGARQERPTLAGGGTKTPERSASAAAPEDQSARTEAEQRTGMTPNAPQVPNASTENRIAEAQPNAPMQQRKPEEPLPQVTREPQQSAQANPVASLKQNEVTGKYLYDKDGNEVASIQSVTTSPDGKIEAVTIDVGGFLGIGSRQVSVPVDLLRLNGNRIEASSLTASQIRSLPHSASK